MTRAPDDASLDADPELAGAMWLAPMGTDAAGLVASRVLARLPVPQVPDLRTFLAILADGDDTLEQLAEAWEIEPLAARALCLHFGVKPISSEDNRRRVERERTRRALQGLPEQPPAGPLRAPPEQDFVARTIPPGDRD